MRIELSQEYFDKYFDADFAVGHKMLDDNEREIEIVKFTGYNEISDCGYSNDEVVVHFSDGSAMELETLDRAVFINGTIKPIAPDWFVDLVDEQEVLHNQIELKAQEIKRAKQAKQDAKQLTQRLIKKEIAKRKASEPERAEPEQLLVVPETPDTPAVAMPKALSNVLSTPKPIEDLSDTELFAKVLGTSLSVAEEVINHYGGNFAQMAGSNPKRLQKVKGIGESRSERLVAAFELGKRLARFHAEREKITSPADVADLMMSKLRYLTKEIVVVLALDTKGGVTSEGKTGENAKDLTWGKMLAESTVFEGTLNASVFHPREIFRFAIEEAANSIILVHNHPSGDPQPSQEDIRATKQLIEAGNQIGIKVLDHIIIGDGIFVSLKEENFI